MNKREPDCDDCRDYAAEELAKAIRRACDEASLHLHSMSDPTDMQRERQRGGSSVVRAVNEVLRTARL